MHIDEQLRRHNDSLRNYPADTTIIESSIYV